MIIAVVDDEAAKRAEVVEIVRQAGGNSVQVCEAASKATARRLLQNQAFDLLIIDIALPELDGGEPELNGGVSLLEDVVTSGRYLMPTQVIGLTALEEVYESAAAKFGGELWSVVRYDRSSSDWREQIAAKTRHILRLASVGSEVETDFDLGIIVALKGPELDAVLSLPWSWTTSESTGDPTVYRTGTFRRLDGTVGKAVVARSGQMGMPAATALATKLGMSFRPKFLAMVGICAGKKGDTNLGDLVAANPVWDYGSGKFTTKDNEEVFEPAPYPLALSSRVRGILESFEGESDVLSALRGRYPGKPPTSVPRLHLGPFGSGAAVVARAAMLEEVQQQHRKLLAIDMEAYGLAIAASELPLPLREFLILKGISDFADEEKDDSQREYAAYLSANFLALLCTDRGLC